MQSSQVAQVVQLPLNDTSIREIMGLAEIRRTVSESRRNNAEPWLRVGGTEAKYLLVGPVTHHHHPALCSSNGMRTLELAGPPLGQYFNANHSNLCNLMFHWVAVAQLAPAFASLQHVDYMLKWSLLRH